ncbi:hypothetical protein PoB_000996700 [Plakobranchus ocellatus]|uniref:Uncharacterized protein n=1 Tax=Plakobranchus ocellatus TaxID=259542 RepID=A0AAV3YKN5_9GAST|nr:hypothetical protein PoB_000996700 [Plakobranchus ocellatus]
MRLEKEEEQQQQQKQQNAIRVAVTVLILLFLAAILSGVCDSCRKHLPCTILNVKDMHGQSRLGHCAWVWSFDEEKGPNDFLGVGQQSEKGRHSSTLPPDHETDLFCPVISSADDNQTQGQTAVDNIPC